MSRGSLVLVALAVGTYAIKAAGPLLLGGRRLPPGLERLAELLPVALLAALVVTSTFADGPRLVLDARLGGLIAAVVALLLRAPFLVVVAAAALAAAGVRLL